MFVHKTLSRRSLICSDGNDAYNEKICVVKNIKLGQHRLYPRGTKEADRRNINTRPSEPHQLQFVV